MSVSWSFTKLLLTGIGVPLLSVPLYGAKPTKKDPEPAAKICTISGNIQSTGLVEIGGNTRIGSWRLIDPDSCAGVSVQVNGNLLVEGESDNPYYCEVLQVALTAGQYYGQMHWWDDGGLGFDFGPEPCVAWPAGGEPPFGVPDTPNAQICPFSLYLSGLVEVEGSENTWEFGNEPSVWLADWTQGPPCEPVWVEGCVENPLGGFSGYGVGSGSATVPPSIQIVFYPEEESNCGAAVSEGNRKSCSDGKDNDLDGLTDCFDADCSRWCQ